MSITNPNVSPEFVKFVTFQQLVDHGIQQYQESGRSSQLVNGMPWAFIYEGWPVSHESDECFIVSSPTPPHTLFVRPGTLLLIDVDGNPHVLEESSVLASLTVFKLAQQANAVQETLSFGRAMDALMSGQRVGNLTWGGEEPWLAVSCPEPTSISSEKFWSAHNRRYAERQYGGAAVVLPCITMKTATGAIQMGWVPTQADMFSVSWYIVKDRG